MKNLIKSLQSRQSKSIESQDVEALQQREGDDLYKIVAVLGQRANQINDILQTEIKNQFREFDSYSDINDEYKDNREQAEISRLYEILPHPTLLALQELKKDELEYYKRDELDAMPATYLPSESDNK